jgi:hypothetical protein
VGAIAVYSLSILIGLFVERNLPGPNAENFAQIRSYTQQHPDRLYAVDDVAARFVFDYNLPPGTIDWVECYMWKGFTDYDRLKCIVTDQKKHFDPLLPVDYPRLRIAGHTFNSIPARVFDSIIMYDLPPAERIVPRYVIPPENPPPNDGVIPAQGQTQAPGGKLE